MGIGKTPNSCETVKHACHCAVKDRLYSTLHSRELLLVNKHLEYVCRDGPLPTAAYMDDICIAEKIGKKILQIILTNF